ncbi:MAG: hypothetical protein P4L46_20445 [Fimbriimonas sp.]|nr:hypothetical protein [Fimbriimonas sp.]
MNLSIRTFNIQKKHFPMTVSFGDRATALLYDLSRLESPRDVKCLASDINLDRIDCADQVKCYRNLGVGHALRVTMHKKGDWPATLSFQVLGKTVTTRIVDPDDNQIRIFTSLWKRQPAHAIRIPANSEVIWLLGQWNSAKSTPAPDRRAAPWESWIANGPSAWARLSAVDIPKERLPDLKRRMQQEGARQEEGNLYVLR